MNDFLELLIKGCFVGVFVVVDKIVVLDVFFVVMIKEEVNDVLLIIGIIV